MRKNRFRPVSVRRRSLPGVLSTHRDPVPYHRANKTYEQGPWLWTDPEVYVLDPGERLHDYLRAFYLVFKGEPTLFYNRRLLGHEGSDEEEGHAVRVGVLGPT